jgi:hypothetical protein
MEARCGSWVTGSRWHSWQKGEIAEIMMEINPQIPEKRLTTAGLTIFHNTERQAVVALLFLQKFLAVKADQLHLYSR